MNDNQPESIESIGLSGPDVGSTLHNIAYLAEMILMPLVFIFMVVSIVRIIQATKKQDKALMGKWRWRLMWSVVTLFMLALLWVITVFQSEILVNVTAS